MYSTNSYHRSLPLSHTSSYLSPSLRLTGYTSSLPPSSYRYTSSSYSTLPSSSKPLVSNLSYSRPSTTSSYRPSYSYTSTVAPERRWRSQSRASDLSSSVGSDRTSAWRSSSVGSSLTSRSGSTSSLTSLGRESWSPRTSRFSSDLKVPSNDLISSSSKGSEKHEGKVGLYNLGNTCFMNAVLQSLCHTEPLVTFCTKGSFTSEVNYKSSCGGSLINAFAGLTRAMWKNDGEGAANPEILKREIQKYAPRFSGYHQQDAQEFLSDLLNGLHDDLHRIRAKGCSSSTPNNYTTDQQKAQASWNDYIKATDSKITELFAGQFKSMLTCMSCDNRSVAYDPFMDLPLPLPEGDKETSLRQCLLRFTSPELMEGSNRPVCERCKRKTETTKQMQINLFPKILVIQLKRFSAGNYRRKLNTMVQYPLANLDLSEISANSYTSASGPYTLYAVVNHSGGTGSGHYTAYCKHPFTGEWYNFNDTRVSKVTKSDLISSNAYLLFYERSSRS